MEMKSSTSQINIEPNAIMQMTNGYWVSQVLYVATKLNIFTHLEGKNLSSEKIADLLKTPLKSTERLLNACCALDLLQKENHRYSNSPLSERFLVEGQKGYLGYLVLLTGQLYKSWGKLLEAVKENKPINERFGNGVQISEEDARFFTLAMHSSSSESAFYLADIVDLSANKKLLDLGGGSGANSIALAEKNSQLEAVVYDFPAVVKVSNEFISKSKAASRVKTQAGDFNRDDLPKGFDCILLAHILHGEGEEGSRNLLKKCYDILEPSGKIIIIDFLLDEDKNGPLFPALFALNMLVETAHGNTFSAQEINLFLRDSGFDIGEIKLLDKSLPAKVIVATKPA